MLKPILLLILSFLSIALYAQKVTVTGRVTDSKGQPLAGASVKANLSGTGTSTNADGYYSVNVDPDEILVISHTGFSPIEIPVNGRTNLNITIQEASAEMQTVLVGTRRAGRVKTETPVPVDLINMNSTIPTGRVDISSILNYAAPSFNYNKQSGSDGGDHVDLATLRGLGPDQTLVLINGKRRHQTSFVAVFGTRGRGNSGTDLNAIPVSSIDRIEILRDGASAQYGSDAIAGVINIILKRSTGQLTGSLGYSAFYDPEFNTSFKKELQQYETDKKIDGRSVTAGINYGWAIGKKGGLLNLSFDYLNTAKTFRQVLDTTDPVNNPDAMYINIYRRANGDASLKMGGMQMNFELPLKGSTTMYSFGGYNGKFSDAFAFTRNFSARPERFPTDANGDIIVVPGIMKGTPDGETYFNPHIQAKIRDIAWTGGLKGINKNSWNWDLSNALGYNRFHFFGDKTFNASLGPNQTHFDDGGFTFLQNTVNLNFSKEISGIGKGFNLAFGAEHRYERYTIFSGEEASYKNYNSDKATGAQGFPGYQPADVVKADRSNIGVYADAELDATESILINGAVRLENYSDFGFTHNYKLATRLKASPHFNLRGSISTGFRAPSLQQINFSSTFTTVQAGSIAEVKIAPNYSPITKAAGIPELKQERSLNAGAGFTYNPIREFNITIDGYFVRIKDRVVLSGQFDASDPDIDPLLASQMNTLNVSLAQFFANAVNTTNKGIDIVLDYNRRAGNNRYRMLLASNFQKMTIDRINVPDKLSGSEHLRQTFLNDREQAFILASAPNSKIAFTLEYGYKKFGIGTRLTRFGEVILLGYGEDGSGIDPKVPIDKDPGKYVRDEYTYSPKFVTDVFLNYNFSKGLIIHAGADNMFNVHPDFGVAPGAKGWAFNNEPAGPFDAVQMGGNGMRFFVRLAVQL
jgi:iron complex outermembrane receptor protein